jgi:hypothetical protein
MEETLVDHRWLTAESTVTSPAISTSPSHPLHEMVDLADIQHHLTVVGVTLSRGLVWAWIEQRRLLPLRRRILARVDRQFVVRTRSSKVKTEYVEPSNHCSLRRGIERTRTMIYIWRLTIELG